MTFSKYRSAKGVSNGQESSSRSCMRLIRGICTSQSRAVDDCRCPRAMRACRRSPRPSSKAPAYLNRQYPHHRDRRRGPVRDHRPRARPGLADRARFSDRRGALRRRRLHRHERLGARQRAHRAGRHERHERGARRRLQGRRHHRHAGGRPRPAGRRRLLRWFSNLFRRWPSGVLHSSSR